MEEKLTFKDEKKYLDNIIDVLKKHDIIHGINPTKFREIIEDLGPTFIKFGQILSTRPDILPEDYCTELEKLRSNAKSLEFSVIKEIIEEELNSNIYEVFEYIDETPLGSASIAQVHKAKLKTGEDVVIKVQRKNIKEQMNLDIALLKKAINTLQIEKILKNVFDINRALDEMWDIAKEELDFTIEESNLKRFKANNEEIVYIEEPEVYSQYTTSRMLVMRRIDGVSILNKEYLKTNGYDLNEIGNKLAVNYIKQVITDGFFHADPHGDNILIEEGKIAFIDFGMMSSLSNRNKNLLKDCIKAIIREDVKEIERVLLVLCDTNINEIDHTKLCNEIQNLLDRYGSTEIKDIDIKDFSIGLFSMISTNKLKLPKDITFLIRGIVILEGVLENIDDSLNLLEVLKNHTKSESYKEMFTKENIEGVLTNVVTSSNSLVSLPNELLTFLKNTNRGETKISFELHSSKKSFDKFEMLLHEIIFCILDASFIIGASLISFNSNTFTDPRLKTIFYIFVGCATFLTILIICKMIRDNKD